jgi:predicted RNase H-like HicB family nuclease
VPSKKELLQLVGDNKRACADRGGAVSDLLEMGLNQATIADSTGLSTVAISHLNTCFQNLGPEAIQACRDGQLTGDACFSLAIASDLDQGWVLHRAKELCQIRDNQKRKGRRTPGGRITDEEIKQAIKEARAGSQSAKARSRPVPRQFDVVIERDEEGFYIASVPALPGCHTQARSLDELTDRIREAIELCLEVSGNPEGSLEFVGIQRVTVAA